MYMVARADGISTTNAMNHIVYHGKSGDLYISPLGASGYSDPTGTDCWSALHGGANNTSVKAVRL